YRVDPVALHHPNRLGATGTVEDPGTMRAHELGARAVNSMQDYALARGADELVAFDVQLRRGIGRLRLDRRLDRRPLALRPHGAARDADRHGGCSYAAGHAKWPDRGPCRLLPVLSA